MARLLLRSAWATFSVFLLKNCPFCPQNIFLLDIQIQDQHPKTDPRAKFQPDWTKDKGAGILTLNDTENCLMMS